MQRLLGDNNLTESTRNQANVKENQRQLKTSKIFGHKVYPNVGYRCTQLNEQMDASVIHVTFIIPYIKM